MKQSIGWVSMRRDKDGSLYQRVNGGSSTPTSRKVYQTKAIAKRYGYAFEAFIEVPDEG